MTAAGPVNGGESVAEAMKSLEQTVHGVLLELLDLARLDEAAARAMAGQMGRHWIEMSLQLAEIFCRASNAVGSASSH